MIYMDGPQWSAWHLSLEQSTLGWILCSLEPAQAGVQQVEVVEGEENARKGKTKHATYDFNQFW